MESKRCSWKLDLIEPSCKGGVNAEAIRCDLLVELLSQRVVHVEQTRGLLELIVCYEYIRARVDAVGSSLSRSLSVARLLDRVGDELSQLVLGDDGLCGGRPYERGSHHVV